MGLGLLGRGVGDAAFLAPLCKELVVTDLKSKEELAPSLEQLKSFSNITYHLGEHVTDDFTHTDMVIKAAGVPLNSPYIAAARAADVPVYMSTALFAKFASEAGATLVGVTGTRGKSTVAAMIYHALGLANKPTHLGGNIRGLSTLAMLPQINKGDIVVLELDSWQLQGFGDLRISPHIAVFTNLLTDHLNYYKSKPDQYFWDKAQIFLHQHTGDKLIVDPYFVSLVQSSNPPVAPIAPPPLPHDLRLKLVGSHNRDNATLAAHALRILGLTEGEVKQGLETFEPVEGRLQLVREINGVKIYNDNNSTTPDATIAALKSFVESKVILIAGGADKGLPLQKFVDTFPTCKKVMLLAGSGTDRILGDKSKKYSYQSIEQALRDAMYASAPGDVVLFSPGFASFGMFTNEYDRNDQFMAAVKGL